MIDSARPQSRGTVMVVEDDPQAARLVQKLLRADGFSVTVVDDGPDEFLELVDAGAIQPGQSE